MCAYVGVSKSVYACLYHPGVIVLARGTIAKHDSSFKDGKKPHGMRVRVSEINLSSHPALGPPSPPSLSCSLT